MNSNERVNVNGLSLGMTKFSYEVLDVFLTKRRQFIPWIEVDRKKIYGSKICRLLRKQVEYESRYSYSIASKA